MNKRIFQLFIMAFVIIFGITGKAAEIDISDFLKGVVTIEGYTSTPNETITILVLDNGITPAEARLDLTKVQFQGEAISDAVTKYYKKTFVFNIVNESRGKNFDIYVKEENNAKVTVKSLYFATFEQKVNVMEQICKGNSLQIENILSQESNRAILSINVDVVKNSNLSTISGRIFDRLTKEPLDAQNKDQALIKLQALIFEEAVLDCYNNGKTEVIYAPDYTFKYIDVLKLDNLGAGVTAYNLFSNNLNNEGKKGVQSLLTGKSLLNIEILKQLFVKGVLFNGIKNNNDSGGFLHVKNYFTEKNVARGNLNIPLYIAIPDNKKGEVSLKIIGDTELTFDNFEKKIEDYSAMKPQIVDAPGGKNAGGGGSGGSVAFTAPIISNTKTETVENIFSDLENSLWAKKSIEALYNKKIVNGIEHNIFKPNDPITREQVIKIICLAQNIALVNSDSTFSDVEKASWYAPYVATAKNKGIVNGISDDLFGVGRYITREDFAVMLFNAFHEDSMVNDYTFSDNNIISEYAKKAVYYFEKKGIVTGYPDNTFKPKNTITRAEVAKIVYHLIKE